MIDRHIRDLRLDRRLLNRPGWISAQDLDDAMGTLPDVADKGEIVTEEEEAAPTPSADPLAPPSTDPLAGA